MFSKTKGLMRAVAKGAKRPKSKLGARIQMFIANNLMLFEGKNLDTIAQAQSVSTFSKIRYDLDKLSYSMYIAELVNNFCSKDFNTHENYKEIYDLIFESYKKIEKASLKKEILLVILKFQIKLMNLLGWGLDFNSCSICQRSLDKDLSKACLFSYSLGGFLCDECTKNHIGDTIRIHNKIRLFLDEISCFDFNQKTSYDDKVNDFVLEKCFSFMGKYINNLQNKKTKIFEVLKKATVL